MNRDRKIPYDASPISRDVPNSRQSPVRKNYAQSLFVVSIFIFNLAISFLFISYIYNNKYNSSVTVNNQIVATDNVSAAATSKAKLSSVCIGVGSREGEKSFSKTNVPTYSQLFNKTAIQGAGVIVDVDKSSGTAYILTCDHVISVYESAVFVLLYDSYQPIAATVVGRSSKYDLAVLKIENEQVKGSCLAANIANSTYVSEGDDAIAVGNPQANGFAVTVGHVSRTSIFASTESGMAIRSIQVDTAINEGNSGGGLFDKNGDLIGIVQTKSASAKIDNVATAIHSNMAISIAKNLIEGRNLQYANLGINLKIVNVSMQYINGRDYRVDTIEIDDIDEDGDAHGCLLAGDTLVAIAYGGKTAQVINEYCLEEMKYNLKVGDVVQFTVIRGGTTKIVQVKVTKLAG